MSAPTIEELLEALETFDQTDSYAQETLRILRAVKEARDHAQQYAGSVRTCDGCEDGR